VTLSGTGDIYYTLDGSDPIGANNKPAAVARKYTIPLPITGPTHLRARHSVGASWSQLADASFLTPSNLATTTDLEVSEVHYHPETNELEEFIEIHNRAQTQTLLLGGGRLSGGVEFVFPNAWMVPPDGHAVVVRDRAAFEAKYGNSLPVAGTFIGSLANEGDWVHLLAASGKVASRFRYNDTPPWPQLADGGGRSLTLRRATESVDPNDPLQWRASSVLGGTPGRDDGTPSPANPLDDADGDGWTALSEYFWGTSDTDAASVPRAAIPIQFTADGHALLQVSHPLGADQVEAFWETSTDLLIWERIPDASMLGTVVEGDRESLQWALLKDVEEQRFFRFNLRLR
jgi:hypothetical protein